MDRTIVSLPSPPSHLLTKFTQGRELAMRFASASTLSALALTAITLLPSASAEQLRFPSDARPITSFSSEGSQRVLSHRDGAKLQQLKGQEGFTVLQHEAFPNHSMRIKEASRSRLPTLMALKADWPALP